MRYSYNKYVDLHVKGRISSEDAERQRETAREILARFRDTPGIILADEVGMGKTFVALAVAASVAMASTETRPVVIMVPPSLREKWPRDFELFREKCVPPPLQKRLTSGRAERGVEFLKLLDDPPDRKRSIIFLTHGAMYRGLSDRWVQLAMIQRALHRRRNIEPIRRSLHRNAGAILGLRWAEQRDPQIWEKLLDSPTDRWLKIMRKSGVDPENDANPDTDDDPVPELVREALRHLDLSKVFEHLKRELPRRQTKHYEIRMRDFRRVLRETMRTLWHQCVQAMDYRLPLLVLDEAHHLKNPSTQLASLFQDCRAKEDADEISRGPFAGVFERMLFLTATPFQLGHHELCSVLNRFSGISWSGETTPKGGAEEFQRKIISLLAKLDRAQESAIRFEHAWGRLKTDMITIDGNPSEGIEHWWRSLGNQAEENSPIVSNILRRFNQARRAMETAETELRPWIIRHNKEREMKAGDQMVPRRIYRVGAQIVIAGGTDSEDGIPVGRDSLMPFLIASRLTTCMPNERPVFAEGLASSYEAFLHTRLQREDPAVDMDDEITQPSIDDRGAWYLDQLEQIIPRGGVKESRSHPKINAVVAKAVELWKRREKVLVFCHYVATGRVLRQHISEAIKDSIIEDGAKLLGLRRKDVEPRLEQLGRRFFDVDSPARRACDAAVLSALRPYRELSDWHEAIMDIVRRYVRTPSFLVRYFPLNKPTIDKKVVDLAMDTRDDSGMSFRELIQSFFDFLTTRCSNHERSQYLQALDSIQTGSISGADVSAAFEESEIQRSAPSSREMMIPNVRLVNGATLRQTRQKLMLTFNTPFFPEILIASSVMAEGVDLHLNCRYVLHHDLCWNPSTLEQRNGRVDRIGGKVEQASAPIHIYLPYIAQTQDEKMYRVVRDRERWFKVVMGEKMTLDPRTTDKIAERVPLPASIAEELAFNLEV